MKQRKYFDLFTTIGRPSKMNKLKEFEPSVLLSDMEYAGIHKAAALLNGAIDYSFEMGNREILKIAKETDRILPLALTPTTAPLETGNPNYYEDLLKAGMRGFVLSPEKPCCMNLVPKSLEKIAEKLCAFDKPLFVLGAGSEARLWEIDTLAQAYPALNIIMVGTSWGSSRVFWEVMSRNGNLYFEYTNNHTNGILELTKEHFGIERVLYSSSWPIKSQGALKCMIEYADLSDADKDMVAHGNACRLLGVDPAELVLYENREAQLDEISMAVDQGKPVSVEVIDAHTHMVKTGCAVNNNIMLFGDHDAMAEKMDRVGIDVTMTAPWSGICYDGSWSNEEALEAEANHPGRYLGYACCNINHPEDVEAVIKYHEAHPDFFVGIKPYPPSQGIKLIDDKYKPWFTYANEHHLCALIHAEDPMPGYADDVDLLSYIYPNITFILAHSGSHLLNAEYNAMLANKRDNIVLEITYTSTQRGMVEYLVEMAGADKVLFGTDAPMRDLSPQLGWVCYSRLSVEDKKKILGGNIKRILAKRK